MTTIVGMSDGSRSWIAADTLAVWSDTAIPGDVRKIFESRDRELAVGVSGTGLGLEIIENVVKDWTGTQVGALLKRIDTVFNDFGWEKKADKAGQVPWRDASMIIATRTRVYEVSSDMCQSPMPTGVAALMGSGATPALGAYQLGRLRGELPSSAFVMDILRAAILCDVYSGGDPCLVQVGE